MLHRLILALCLCAVASAQPAFEVASIRLSKLPLENQQLATTSGPNLTLEGFTWFDLVLGAFDLKDYQLGASAGVVKALDPGVFYTVQAKAEGNAARSDAEFRAMSQSLLVTRFHLKFHRETKQMPVYALVVGKEGIKFKESDPASERSVTQTSNGRNVKRVLKQFTMSSFVDHIEGFERPIIDQTGLAGVYDFTIEYTPEFLMTRDPQPGDISIFTAIQTLGLKLESQRAPVEILVVDSIERPSEN